uniref:Uncharacterized protein n=1 Tax=Heterorhabditis bacteriophora TaxID=37862 RepID=A0A1I7XSS4_HETBA
MISRPETPVPSENSLGREGVQLSTSPAQSQPQTSASPVRRTGFMALTRNLFASSNREKVRNTAYWIFHLKFAYKVSCNFHNIYLDVHYILNIF